MTTLKGGTPREGMEGCHGKKGQPGRCLVRVVKDAMGELDTRPNWLQYEGSKFEILRTGCERSTNSDFSFSERASGEQSRELCPDQNGAGGQRKIE